MLHILFLILKIIVILLAVILGLLILIVCSVLFVPIRWKLQAGYEADFTGEAHVTWLFHLLHVAARFDTGQETPVEVVVKILGIRVFSYPPVKKQEAEKKPKGKKAAKEEPSVIQEQPEEQAQPKTAAGTLEGQAESAQEAVPEEPVEPSGTSESEAAKQAKEGPGQEPGKEKQEEASKREKAEKKTEKKKAEKKEKAKEEEQEGAFGASAQTKLEKLQKTFQTIKEKKDAVCGILFDERNQAAFRKVKRTVLHIVRHLLPVRLSGTLTFGFSDPATTGYLLGVLSMLYPIYEDQLELHPDFDNQVFAGKIDTAGRIRICVFVFAAVKLILDKDLRRILKSFKNVIK